MTNHQEIILQAAEDLVLKKGWKALSIRTLGQVLGTTGQAIYKHFKDKEDLLQNLVLRRYSEFLGYVNSFAQTYLVLHPNRPQIEADGLAYLWYWADNPYWFDLFREWVVERGSLRIRSESECYKSPERIETELSNFLQLPPESLEVREKAWELQCWWFGLALSARAEIRQGLEIDWPRYERSIRRSILLLIEKPGEIV